jgi:hypothetical protein
MEVVEVQGEDLINLIKEGRVIGKGCFGVLLEINEFLVLKFYYKSFFGAYESRRKEVLVNEVEREKEIDDFVVDSGIAMQTRLNYMLNNFKRLVNTKNENFIKGIATINNYPVGIFMKNLKTYNRLTDVCKTTSNETKELIISKIYDLLEDLESHGVYPTDLREDNILVRMSDLDVVIIDLDGKETRYEDDDYIFDYPDIKKEVANMQEKLVRRLRCNNGIR